MNPHAGTSGVRPPFTSTQWQELEHQALIFKYMIAGMPVPPDLLLPIRASLDSSRFFPHATMGYCSFYGKKADPEPGRCRRTDGKKWRCSKDAHPDSKYCERHMHRGRNRSRKPVESPAVASQPTSSSAVAALSVAVGGSGSGTASSCNFDGLPLHASVSGHLGSQASQLLVDPNDYGMSSKDYRYLHGIKGDVDEHSFFAEASGSVRGLGTDSTAESWRLLPSSVSSFPPAKQRSSGVWQSSFPQVQGLQDVEPASLASAIPKQQQHCFFGHEIGSSETVKQEGQPLRPFFDEWPKTRDSWSDLDDDRSNRSSFSTTQLSISIPMTSSDFSATSSRSPNDD